MATQKQRTAARKNIRKALAKRFGRRISKRKAVNMARRGGFHRKKKNFTLPLAVVGGFLPVTIRAVDLVKSGGISNLKYLTKRLIPWDGDANGGKGKFSTQYLGEGLFPIVAGFAVHMVANKLGVNKMLARAGVPLIRV